MPETGSGRVTAPQHLDALRQANEVRLARAALRRELREGRTSIADALRHPSVANMRVVDVLAYQSRWGVGRAQNAVRGICSTRKLVRDLTDRQHGLLAAVAAGRLVFDQRTGQHITAQEAAERGVTRRWINDDEEMAA